MSKRWTLGTALNDASLEALDEDATAGAGDAAPEALHTCATTESAEVEEASGYTFCEVGVFFDVGGIAFGCVVVVMWKPGPCALDTNASRLQILNGLGGRRILLNTVCAQGALRNRSA